MEEGKEYEVFYNDGQSVKKKNLIFKKIWDTLYVFTNVYNGEPEEINKNLVIRAIPVKK